MQIGRLWTVVSLAATVLPRLCSASGEGLCTSTQEGGEECGDDGVSALQAAPAKAGRDVGSPPASRGLHELSAERDEPSSAGKERAHWPAQAAQEMMAKARADLDEFAARGKEEKEEVDDHNDEEEEDKEMVRGRGGDPQDTGDWGSRRRYSDDRRRDYSDRRRDYSDRRRDYSDRRRDSDDRRRDYADRRRDSDDRRRDSDDRRRGGGGGGGGDREGETCCMCSLHFDHLGVLLYSAGDYSHNFGAETALRHCEEVCSMQCSLKAQGQKFGCYNEQHILWMKDQYLHQAGWNIWQENLGNIC